MKRWNGKWNRLFFALSTLGVGMTQLNGCGLGSIASDLAGSVNPCGTILDCDPAEFDLLFRENEYPDFDRCPISVFPQDCEGFPFNQGGGGGGGNGANNNNNNTNTNTNTNTTNTTNTTTNTVTNPFFGFGT